MSQFPSLPNSHLFADLDIGRTHYQLEGPEDGPILLLIHGATVPCWEFDRLVPYLAEAGFRIIRADLLGHGYSDRPDVVYDIDLFREQLIQLLMHLRVTSTVHIVGHSMGAAVGGSLISHYPDRFGKLVLAAPLVNFVENRPIVKLTKIDWFAKIFINCFAVPLLKIRRRRIYGPIDEGRFIEKFHTQFRLPGFERTLLSLFRDGALDDQTALYNTLNEQDHDYLIIRGELDDMVTEEQIFYLASLLQQAEVRDIAGTGHAFMLTDPHLVAPEIISFFEAELIEGNSEELLAPPQYAMM